MASRLEGDHWPCPWQGLSADHNLGLQKEPPDSQGLD
jgi:hypothetical protein